MSSYQRTVSTTSGRKEPPIGQRRRGDPEPMAFRGEGTWFVTPSGTRCDRTRAGTMGACTIRTIG